MNKLPLVLFTLCIASASCVKLEGLCPQDLFGYNGVIVTAFYRSRLNITFPPLNEYLINSSIPCEPSEFVNKTNHEVVMEIRDKYNRKFAEFYTKNLSNATAEELADKERKLTIKYWIPLYDMMRKEESSNKCVRTFERIALSACGVLRTLTRIGRFIIHPINDEAGFEPSSSEAIKALEELFKKLNNTGDGQVFALKDETASEVYNFKRGLVQPIEFKFLTDGPVQPDTKATLIYEQYLPFYKPTLSDSLHCVPVKLLPMFYKSRGREYI